MSALLNVGYILSPSTYISSLYPFLSRAQRYHMYQSNSSHRCVHQFVYTVRNIKLLIASLHLFNFIAHIKKYSSLHLFFILKPGLKKNLSIRKKTPMNVTKSNNNFIYLDNFNTLRFIPEKNELPIIINSHTHRHLQKYISSSNIGTNLILDLVGQLSQVLTIPLTTLIHKAWECICVHL